MIIFWTALTLWLVSINTAFNLLVILATIVMMGERSISDFKKEISV
jgi:hypothetical protein